METDPLRLFPTTSDARDGQFAGVIHVIWLNYAQEAKVPMKQAILLDHVTKTMVARFQPKRMIQWLQPTESV